MPADRGHWWVVVGVLRQGAAQVECPASGSSPGVLIGVGELVKAGLEGSATFGVEDHPCGREVSRRITTVDIGGGCLHQSIICQALNGIKVVSRRGRRTNRSADVSLSTVATEVWSRPSRAG